MINGLERYVHSDERDWQQNMERPEGFLAGNSHIWNLQCDRQNDCHSSLCLELSACDRLSLCGMWNDEGYILYSYRAHRERNEAQSGSTVMDCIDCMVLLEPVCSRHTQKKYNVLVGSSVRDYAHDLHISNDKLFSR